MAVLESDLLIQVCDMAALDRFHCRTYRVYIWEEDNLSSKD